MLLKLFVSVTVLIFLQSLGMKSPALRYYVGVGTFMVSMLASATVGVVVALPLTLVGRQYDISWVVARVMHILSSNLLGITFEVEGEEYLDTPNAVYIGNHQTMLDIVYLGRTFPRACSVMAKKSLKWTPVLGQFMTLSGAVFIDRTNNKDAVRAMAAAGEDMKARGISIFIFPEGTRTSSEKNDLLPFKKGAFHLAVQAGIPIVPVVCENYWHLYRRGIFETGVLKIKVLPPIYTTGLKPADVNDLTTTTREIMLKALNSISSSAGAKTPTQSTPSVLPVGVPHSSKVPSPPSSDDSGEHITASVAGLRRRKDGTLADLGEITDEDDGMVLVGRP